MAARLLFTSVLLFATAGYIAYASAPEIVPLRDSLTSVPLQIQEWQGRNEPAFSAEILAQLGVDDYLIRTYYSPPQSLVNLYVGFYASQRQGDTIHSPLNCMPGSGWLPVKQARTTLSVPGPQGSTAAITVNRFVIQKGVDRQLVLYWYQSHGRAVASEYASKLYLVADAIRLNRSDAALVRVMTPIIGNSLESENSASERAEEFVRALFPSLYRVLPS
jgi:EpsI family protein